MENQSNRAVSDYEEIDLKDVVKILIKRKKMIFGLALAGAAIVAALNLQSVAYRAEAVMEIGSLASKSCDNGAGIDLISVESPLAVKEKIERGIYGAIARQKTGIAMAPEVKVSYVKETNIINLTVENSHPEKLKEYLSFFCEEVFEDHRQKSEIWQTALGLVKIGDTKVIRTEESGPIRSNVALNAAFAALISLFLGIFLALMIDWWNNSKNKR